MKKFTLLLVIALCFGFHLSAQDTESLVFIRNGEIIPSGSTVYVKDVENPDFLPTMHPRISVKNQTEAVVNASLTITLLEDTDSDGSVGYCGWGTTTCAPIMYGNPITRTTTIAANTEADPDLEIVFVNPESISFKIEYKLAYNGQTQTLTIVFTSDPTASIPSISDKNDILILNEGSNTSLKYNFAHSANRSVCLYNAVGTKITEFNLTNDSGQVLLPSLSKGIYIYAIKESNRFIKSGKFIAQ